MAESFFAALKTEWTDRMVFATRAEARHAIVSYIEGFYNRQRLHSGLDYKTPREVHEAFTSQQKAARYRSDNLSGKRGADHKPLWVRYPEDREPLIA
jgi:transposase InsO family protein